MLRLAAAVLLLGSTSLAAQEAEAPAPLRSGAAVRVFLHEAPGVGAAGVVVSGSADTLRVISPALGLAALAAEEVARLETLGRAPGRKWRYAGAVLGISALAAALAPSEDAGFTLINSVVAFGSLAGGFYLLEGPGSRTIPITPASGLPEVRPPAGDAGIPVRIATREQRRTDHRLRDFTADSVYLAAGPAIARAEITSLQVSVGRDRRRGALRGALIGGLAGGVLAGGALAAEGGYGVLFAPFGFIIGGALGAGAGVPIGSALAPRTWSEVPLPRPER